MSAAPEHSLFSSSDYDDEELARLVELQRRQTELLRSDIDNLDFEDDDFSVSRPSARAGPKVPDMRFGQQVETSIKALQEKGSSNLGIFWSVVIKDQIIIPFVSGFTWSLCSTAWKWYRTKGVVNKNTNKVGFFRTAQHGFADWTKHIYNTIVKSTAHLFSNTATIAAA